MAESPFHPLNQSCLNCSSIHTGTSDDSSSSSIILSQESMVILSVTSALASLIGSVGNALILLAVLNNENLRTIPDLFITSLAFSDFTVCALFLPMSIYHFHHTDVEDEIVAFNMAKSFLGHTSMVASATNLFAVTVDRVMAIRFPFKYVSTMTTLHALVEIAVVWVISIAFGALYTREFISRLYIAFYSVILLFSTMGMYIYIFITAKRQENRIQEINQASDGSVMEKKVAKTIFTVVGIYAICWLPMLLLPAFVNPSTKPIQFAKGFPWVQNLLACNSALNPFIYCMRSRKYRSAFGKILRMKHFRSSINASLSLTHPGPHRRGGTHQS